MIRSQRGMSLVEATIIVMVIATLTAMIAPVAGNYIEDARNTTAKAETEAIGSAVLQLLADTGSRCLKLDGRNTTATDCTVSNRVDLLVTNGPSPGAIDLVAAPDITLPDSESAIDAVVNWLPDDSAPTKQDLLEDQLIENDNPNGGYPVVSFTNGGGPRMKLGWRGPYLNGPFTADPWGAQYQVNTIFLTVATTAVDTGFNDFQEGMSQGGWNRDVVVLSAGSNGTVQTSFGGTGAIGVSAGGDDVTYVVRGSSR